MPFQFTSEQRQVVLEKKGQPVHIHDAASQKVFVIVEQGIEPSLDEEYIRQGLDVAREQIERGDVSERNIKSIIAEAERRHIGKD